jgi:DNA-binding Xre family transcriptional regulator
MRLNPVPIFLAIMDRDLSIDEVLARAKIGWNTLDKIKRGEMVRLKSIKRLCLSLGISPKEVLTDASAPTQEKGPTVLGDSGGPEEDQHGHDAEGVGRARVRELLPARKRDPR